MKKRYLLLISMILVLLSACRQGDTGELLSTLPTASPLQSPVETGDEEPVVDPTSSPLPLPTPGEGKAVVGGRLYNLTGDGPIPGTIFYLLRITSEEGDLPAIYAPNADEGDVRGVSDAEGTFVLTDVPPGEYVLLVWAPYSWIEGQVSESDATPLRLEIEPGDVVDLNTVYLPWP